MRNSVTSSLAAGGAAIIALTLSACTTTQADFCDPVVSSGALVQNTHVLGTFGSEPTVNIPEGFTVSGAQRLVLNDGAQKEASGKKATTPGDAVVSIKYALYDSTTGEQFEASGGFEADSGTVFVPVIAGESQGAFLDSLKCSSPGERILVGFSAQEAEPMIAALQLPSDTNILALADVHEVVPMQLSGKALDLPSGFPGVVNDSSGQPGVVLVPGQAPNETSSAIRIAGEGKEVLPEDEVIANYLQVSWDGTLLQNTRETGGPSNLGTSEGGHPVRDLLNGANVGSQMVYIQSVAGEDAEIFVVDILAAG